MLIGFRTTLPGIFSCNALLIEFVCLSLQSSGGSLWGAPTPVSATMSLAQIQQQEERDRHQRELKLQQLQAQQQREQQARGVPGWAERPPVTSQPVKSLLQIQQEQAQQQNKRQQGPALSRSQVGKSQSCALRRIAGCPKALT